MRVIDSHTEGEPTRLIVDGGPPLGDGPLAERRRRLAEQFDHVRGFAVGEPRGHDALVGALLCEPEDARCAAGLIFFNNVGYLGMCGHATIGAAVTLAHLGRIDEARDVIADLLKAQPGSNLRSARASGFRDARMAELYIFGLEKAGLPE